MPENQLFGVMYVGDNDATSFPLTIPAGKRQRRVRRRPDLAQHRASRPNVARTSAPNSSAGSGTPIPTQAQYASREPAGVKRLTETNVQVATDDSWLLDEGRQRANIPPPGQPGTVNAVKYTRGERRARVRRRDDAVGDTASIETAILASSRPTYNILSDMGVQPGDAGRASRSIRPGNKAPTASFTVHPEPGQAQPGNVTFNASASTDTDGTIVKYEWDLDGNGTYETNTGIDRRSRKTYTTEGRPSTSTSRVTDNGGATDFTTRTVQVIGNQPPTASFTAAPNPVVVGQTVTFNGSGSTDPDGTIVKYEWDLDGNGTFETNTGTTKTATKSYAAAGTGERRLRVTDNGGKTATTTVAVTVSSRRRQRLPRCRARHARPRRLLAPRRRRRARRSPTARAPVPARRAASRSASPAASPAIPTPPPGSTVRAAAARSLSTSPGEPDHRRVLAEVERLLQRRQPRHGVHTELQQQQRRIPGRPQLAAAGRQVRRRHRQRPGAKQRVLRTGPAPASGTTTPSSSTRRAPAATRDHALRRRGAGDVHQGRQRYGRGNFANSTLYLMSRGGSFALRRR